jgi:peptide deformylase
MQMSVLPIHIYGTSVLRKKALPVKQVTDEIVKLVMDMHETMHASQGIGLAANQVGSLHRVIVVDLSGIEEMKDFKPMTLLNPEIISEEGTWTMEEGCLSIPDVRDDVERAEIIKVKYQDTNLQDVQIEAGGMVARVILHEIDHLNGVLFIDHLPEEKQKLHIDELKRIQRGEMDVAYPIVTAPVKARLAKSKV